MACVIHDMRVFVLSILSTIGWLTFTIGFAVLITNNPRYFGLSDKPEFNALTAVHFILACAGWAVNAFCFGYSILSGKKRCCGPFLILIITSMLIVSGGVLNDYGRIAYSAETINSSVPGTLVNVPDSAKAAMAGTLIYVLMDLVKLMMLYNPTTSSTTLAYQSKV